LKGFVIFCLPWEKKPAKPQKKEEKRPADRCFIRALKKEGPSGGGRGERKPRSS